MAFLRKSTAQVLRLELFSRFSRRLASSAADIVGDEPILVRDFIRSALYDKNHGYFSKSSGSVGVLDRAIRFDQLKGRKDYMRHVESLYKQHDISWFTPVELFKPWYAHGIAEAILRTADLSVPLKIYEIGGGSGTCAKNIMDYMMLNAPSKVYNNMSYISVEISPSLAERQLETVGDVQTHLLHYKVECRDAADRSGWGIAVDSAKIEAVMSWEQLKAVTQIRSFLGLAGYCRRFVNGFARIANNLLFSSYTWFQESRFIPDGDADLQPCWVIMLEVLDNLPHDLICSQNQISEWKEVWLEKSQGCRPIAEVFKPLQDSLVARCVDIIGMENTTANHESRVSTVGKLWSKVFPKPQRVWLPTGCLELLDVLHWALPKMSMVISDFSYLPDVKIPGERAPLVSMKKDGNTVDYSSYLDAKGDADIFFPTDFWLLEQIDHHCSRLYDRKESSSSKILKNRRTITLDTASFMEEFGLPSKTRTRDGFNPLLDDFKNTKFYISVPTHNIK